MYICRHTLYTTHTLKYWHSSVCSGTLICHTGNRLFCSDYKGHKLHLGKISCVLLWLQNENIYSSLIPLSYIYTLYKVVRQATQLVTDIYYSAVAKVLYRVKLRLLTRPSAKQTEMSCVKCSIKGVACWQLSRVTSLGIYKNR